MPASASTNLETSSSLAGISVALNNFYASTEEPEQALASVFDAAAVTSAASGGGGGQAAQGGQSGETAAATTAAPETTKAKSSPYDNVAVSKVNGYVNIRTEANTTSGVTGKIYNDSAATILDTPLSAECRWKLPDRFGYTPMHLGGICPVGIAKSHAYPLEKTDYRR